MEESYANSRRKDLLTTSRRDGRDVQIGYTTAESCAALSSLPRRVGAGGSHCA